MLAHSETQGSSPDAGESSESTAATQALILAHRDESTGNIVVPTPVDGNPLEFRPGAKCLTEEQHLLLGPLGIKREYDPAAVLNFLMDARRRGFDPFSREIFLMLYKTRFGPQYTHHIGIHGMRRHVVATRTYGGILPVKYSGDDGKWLDIWPYRDVAPYVCRVVLRHREWDEPVQLDAYYDEYAPMVDEYVDDVRTGLKVPAPMWRPGAQGGKANLMIRKCATAGAFREGWPAMLGNWYDKTEFERVQAESDDLHAAQAANSREARRAQAYAASRGGRTVDAADLGVTLVERAAAAGVVDPDAPDTMPADRVRAMLLAERDAQAAILDRTPAFMVARWREAHAGADFEAAPLGQIAAHLEACRSYVVTRLRADGRAEMADRYAAAERPGTLTELFGVQRVDALQKVAA